MKSWCRAVVLLLVCSSVAGFAQQTKKTGVVDASDLKTVVPTTYYFDGLVASVQARNSGAFRFANGKVFVAAFVDNSGYSSDVAQKYQGLLITETKIVMGDAELAPGEYGFGFTKDDKFVVMNVAAEDLLQTGIQKDESLKRPVPLKIVAEGEGFRLYAGKKYVSVKAK